jgi:hypothetical protein
MGPPSRGQITFNYTETLDATKDAFAESVKRVHYQASCIKVPFTGS